MDTEERISLDTEADEEEMSVEDLAESNQLLISAIIEVLQRKGVLTQTEIDTEVESIQAEDEEDDNGDEEEEEVPPATPSPSAPHPGPVPSQQPSTRPSANPQPGIPPQGPRTL